VGVELTAGTDRERRRIMSNDGEEGDDDDDGGEGDGFGGRWASNLILDLDLR
jgi:hypothetical protein